MIHQRSTESPAIGVFILAKNEEANIGRCLRALHDSEWQVHVLDSGSTDGTRDAVSAVPRANFVPYTYTTHCNAYNEITTELGAKFDCVIILDADMIMEPELQLEVGEFVRRAAGRGPAALRAPIQMCSEGVPLRYASLCPPKPFVFVAGHAYFVSTGHGEQLKKEIPVQSSRHRLRHDDRKPYSSYLQSQYRYAANLVRRYDEGNVSGRDRFRVRWPLLVFAVPFVSYFAKLGFLDGRAGFIYALDRLIAEAILHRQAVAHHAKREERS